jgi:hypothetical protein
MELDMKVYTREEVDSTADELGKAMSANVDNLLATCDINTLSQLISFRFGVATLNHNHWSKKSDSSNWAAILSDNEADIIAQQEMVKLLGNEETKKLSDGKQKAMAEAAAVGATQKYNSSKADKALCDVYKNFWAEWISYLSAISNLVRDVVIQRSVDAKISPTT